MRRAALVALILGLAMPGARAERPARPAPTPPELCRQAIQAAEREHRLPAGLLHAIGRVEAGRPDPNGGSVTAWPWTINAEGQSRYFESKEEAVAAVQALQARGVKLIDVGCLQINLYHHPQAFPDLDAAFDPAANARYAGLFLTRLYGQSRNWEQAAANYHSFTPELGEAYRIRVMAAWPAMAAKLAEEQRREALVAAWNDGKVVEAKPIFGNGFQVVAIAQPNGPRGRNAPLLMMGSPVLRPAPSRVASRPVGTPRTPLLEVAEAPSPKRR